MLTGAAGSILGIKEESRNGVMLALWNYIKLQDLQDKSDPKKILLDAPLQEVGRLTDAVYALPDSLYSVSALPRPDHRVRGAPTSCRPLSPTAGTYRLGIHAQPYDSAAGQAHRVRHRTQVGRHGPQGAHEPRRAEHVYRVREGVGQNR